MGTPKVSWGWSQEFTAMTLGCWVSVTSPHHLGLTHAQVLLPGDHRLVNSNQHDQRQFQQPLSSSPPLLGKCLSSLPPSALGVG